MPAAQAGPALRSIPKPDMLYVGTYRIPSVIKIDKPEPWQGSYDFIGKAQTWLPGPRGLPLLKPPFGSIVAIDMNTGEHRWRIPVGRSSAMPCARARPAASATISDCRRAAGRC